MGTRYNEGDIVKVKHAQGEHLPEGEAEVVEVHDLGSGKKTNYEIRHFDDRMEGTGVFNASELELVRRGDEIPQDKHKVRTLERIPEFMGEDFETYGEYKKGEEVLLPKWNAEVLEERGSVEIIERGGL